MSVPWCNSLSSQNEWNRSDGIVTSPCLNGSRILPQLVNSKIWWRCILIAVEEKPKILLCWIFFPSLNSKLLTGFINAFAPEQSLCKPQPCVKGWCRRGCSNCENICVESRVLCIVLVRKWGLLGSLESTFFLHWVTQEIKIQNYLF